MKVGELCVRDVVTATCDETVIAVARRMAEHHVGDVIVVVEQARGLPKPIGILTDRDLVVHVLACERDPNTTKVAEVMRRELVIGLEDDDVERVIAKMREHTIRRIPIVDGHGGLQGVLSIDDVLGWMRDQIQAATKLVERQGRGPQIHVPLRR